MADFGETPEQRLEQEVVAWSDAVYDEAERDLADSREIKLTSKLIDYISGQQWNAKSRYGRSRPTVNRLFRQFVEMAGLLTDIEPDFQIKFWDEDEQYQALQKLINDSITMWAQVSDFEMELTQAVMWALLHTGWAKIQWNSALNGGLGDNEFIPLGPINVMTIGAGHKLQNDECVIARWPATIESLKRTFGDVANGVIPDLETGGPTGEATRPGKISEAKWAAMNPQLKRLLGKQSPTNMDRKKSRYPKAMMKQFWFRDDSKNTTSTSRWVGNRNYNWSYLVEPGMPWYPRGRFLIVAGGKVMQDGPNPYWHAQFPFAKLRLIRVPWSPFGVSPLDPIAMMSDIVNRINGGIMDMIRAVIEPRIVAPKAAFAQSVWDSMDPGAPGAKMMYNNNTPREPSFPKPAELPAYVLQMKQDVEKEQDMSSGASAIQQSLQKKQVPGGDSLEMIMNSRSIPIRFMGRGLSSFLVEVGTLISANIMQFSTSKKRAAQFGAKGLTDADFEPFYGQFLEKGVEPERFVRQMVFSIRKGSLLNIEKQDEVTIAFGMLKLGVLSRKALYRKLGIPQSEQERIERELLQEAQQKIALAGAAGAVQHKDHGHK
jgi:hypothetical protein